MPSSMLKQCLVSQLYANLITKNTSPMACFSGPHSKISGLFVTFSAPKSYSELFRNCGNHDKMYQKLSYRRDSAHRRSLRRSKSLKVTNFGTNRKPICDFLLLKNTNILLAPLLSYSRVFVKLLLFNRGVALFNAFVRGEPPNSQP